MTFPNGSSLTTRVFRALAISALLLTAMSLAPMNTASAQEQQRSPLLAPGCTYEDCAIRVEDGWFSRRIIQGTDGREVARLGIGGPNPVTILGVNEQATLHAQRYQSRQRTGTTLSVIGAVGSIATYIALLDRFEDESKRNTLIAINIGSLVTSYIGRGYLQSARRELDRAVWWFNQDASR